MSIGWLQAQQVPMDHFTVEQGLPSSEVFDITQDAYGYLWFATSNGLSRYNGYAFQNYNVSDGLTGNVIFNFCNTKKGIIWCNSLNHRLFFFSGDHPVFTQYKYNDSIVNRLTGYQVDHGLYVDPDTNVFLNYTNSRGYLKITSNGKVENRLRLQPKSASQVIDMLVVQGEKLFSYPVEKEDSDPKLLHSNEFLQRPLYHRCTYLPKHLTSVFMNDNEIRVEGKTQPFAINYPEPPVSVGVFDDDHFWVGYRGGGIRVFHHSGPYIRQLLDGRTVSALFRDHEGSVWLSTITSGVYRIRNINIHVCMSYTSEREWVESIGISKEGKIYAGSYGGQLYQIDGVKATQIHQFSSRTPARVASYDKENFVYAHEGLYALNNAQLKHIQPGFIRSLTPIPTGYALMGTRELSLVHKSGRSETIPVDYRIESLCWWSDTLFLGSTVGLLKLIGTKVVHSGFKDDFTNAKIGVMATMGNSMIIGSQGRGVLLRSSRNTVRLTRKEGLTSNSVNKVYSPNGSEAWLATNRGINLLKKRGEHFEVSTLTEKDGLPGGNVSDILLNGDTVWVATRKGLCYFERKIVDGVERKSLINRFLAVQQVRVNDVERKFQKELHLSYNENRIEIRFQAISFKDELVYRFRLIGLEDMWTVTNSRHAVYPSVPPGTYTFVLQVGTNEQNWENEQVKIAIHVSPPFWKTWWFRTLVILTLLLTTYLFFRFNILMYNKDIIRELLRRLLRRFKGDELYVVLRDRGKEIKVRTSDIGFVKSEGNYIEFHTINGKYFHRMKFNNFMNFIPDPLEFIKVHRSYIVRVDKVEQKGSRELVVLGESIPVSRTYTKELDKITFEV